MVIHEKSRPKKKIAGMKTKIKQKVYKLTMLLVPSEGYIVTIKKNEVDEKKKKKLHQIIKKIKMHTHKK